MHKYIDRKNWKCYTKAATRNGGKPESTEEMIAGESEERSRRIAILKVVLDFWDSISQFHHFIYVLLYIIAGFIIYKIAKCLVNVISKHYKPSELYWKFLKQAIKGILIMVVVYASLDAIPQLRSISTIFLTSTSIIMAIIGLASQESIGNIVSGMMISFFKPFAVGDRVTIISRNITGVVEDINFRHTVIKTFENNRLLIPNSLLNKEIIENKDHIDNRVCNLLDIKVSCEADLSKVKDMLTSVVTDHSLHVDMRTDEEIQNNEPEVQILIRNIAAGAVELRVSIWSKNVNDNFILCSDIREKIIHEFARENIKLL